MERVGFFCRSGCFRLLARDRCLGRSRRDLWLGRCKWVFLGRGGLGRCYRFLPAGRCRCAALLAGGLMRRMRAGSGCFWHGREQDGFGTSFVNLCFGRRGVSGSILRVTIVTIVTVTGRLLYITLTIFQNVATEKSWGNGHNGHMVTRFVCCRSLEVSPLKLDRNDPI